MSYETQSDIQAIATLRFEEIADGILRSQTGIVRRTMEDTVFMVEIEHDEIRFIPYAGTRRSVERYRLVPVRGRR